MKPVLALLILVLSGVVHLALAAAPDWAGSYRNDELSLELRAGQEQLTGTITRGRQRFALVGRLKDGALAGTFTSDEGSFDFTAALEGTKLTLTTAGTSYTLTKQGTNPLAKPPPTAAQTNQNPLAKATAPAPETKPAHRPDPTGEPAHGVPWKTYKHPTGLTMRYPDTWRLNEGNAFLQLVPPDAAANADGPTEAYLALAEEAGTVRSVEDPQLASYLDLQLRQLAPFLTRAGAPERISAATTPGMLLTWEGANPRGLAIRAQAYTTLLKGFGVALVALGEKSQLAAREKTLRAIFASFAAGEGEKDPNLVGQWKYWSYSSSSDGKFSTERSRGLVLRADGTCGWSGRTDTAGSVEGKDSLGNVVYTGGLAGTSGDGDRGTWSAGKGRLFVLWQDGSLSEWEYQVSGAPGQRRLLLKSGQAKPDEWVEGQ